mmetsp:Transcript_27441/g.47559  ORF Transcript_27441/g.47559 Transcript_27441/m.47559 type:complete len:1096 (-) Transcript_27441:85-3372(-)
MASNQDEDFGLNAYQNILEDLEQWGESTPVSTPRYSSGSRRHYDDTTLTPTITTPATPASVRQSRGANDDVTEEEDAFSPSSLRSPNVGTGRRDSVGVQTPEPPQGHGTMTEGQHDNEDDFIDTEQLIGDGIDSYRPYHDALLNYLQSRERLSKVMERENEYSMMQIDGDDTMLDSQTQAEAAVEDSEMKFLASLASICLLRGHTNAGSASDDGNVWNEASKNEGNFWDLLSVLRTGGLSSLFYCVNGEEIPDLTLSNDPSTMVESAPADVLDACLGGDDRNASLPLQRLNAALGWIEACHGRKFEEALNNEYEGNDDPILPPPRRRTMWPGTVAALQQQRNGSSSGVFHPDAPLQSAFGGRSSSPVDVSSFLTPDDEVDDARLLRACFVLLQAGRMEDAMTLVNDCGQPWRAVAWTGGEPLSSDGVGNPTRAAWKRQCRKISKKMAQIANTEASSMVDSTGTRGLYPSLAYEAAIMSLLSDNVDTALHNPVFQTWEDGVHAIIRSELGIIEDDVLRSHNSARVAAAEASGGHFPYPGTELDSRDDSDGPQGNDGDLGAALEKLDASPVERIREEGGDPFRNGMTSFLVGQNALKEYIEECATLCLEAENDDEACFLRFITHLILYVDTVLPEFCSQLALPTGMDAAADGSITLRELLIFKYVAYLSLQRDLWPHVALYTSLLSSDNILDTYSSFLIHVHSDQERQMTLKQARDLFPNGLDCYILRNVVRGMVMCDTDKWAREPGEEVAPVGVAPADARMMRSIHWLCYYPEHRPDALVCANMLLRRFLLSYAGKNADASDRDLYAPKVFIEKILPKDLIDVAVDQCQREDEEREDEAIVGSISLPLVQNLEAEFLSIENYLKAHTKYVQFLDAIAKTSPCHKSSSFVDGSQSRQETEIADKMERNAFRQKKMGLCKIIVEFASRVSDSLMEVLTFAGGWLIDVNSNLTDEETESEEAKARSEELEAIRSTFVPRAVFMLQEILDKTAMWLEQIVYDTRAQFGSASKDMLLTLFGSFDETYRSNDDLTIDLLTTSRAAPGYWHKKALSLASIVANDGNGLHETFDNGEMESFLKLMAESYIKLNRCSNGQTFFDY